jgi:hypothetical protein
MASLKKTVMALMVTSLLVIPALAQPDNGDTTCLRQQDQDRVCDNMIRICDATGRQQCDAALGCGYGLRGRTASAARRRGGAQQRVLDMDPLTEAEIAHVLYMRQEEKLARDVYTTFDEVWLADIFARIAGSEQRHMDAIAWILEIQGLADPVTDDTEGMFPKAEGEDTDFAQLYADLTAAGDSSYVEALRTGAYIEELDIVDLQESLKNVENEYLAWVFGNLMRGSRNHLRAFVTALQAEGETYTPQLMEQTQYDEIVGSSVERGGRNR